MVHEMTHAKVHAIAGHKVDWIIYEYIAAVIQVGSLDATSRASLFRAFPNFSAQNNSGMLNEIIYAIAPLAFVISAYVNSQSFPDQCKHIRKVISTNAIATQ